MHNGRTPVDNAVISIPPSERENSGLPDLSIPLFGVHLIFIGCFLETASAARNSPPVQCTTEACLSSCWFLLCIPSQSFCCERQ
jgi:hypothetical protein